MQTAHPGVGSAHSYPVRGLLTCFCLTRSRSEGAGALAGGRGIPRRLRLRVKRQLDDAGIIMEESSLTAPTHAAARVVLKPRKALPFYGRHPWVLASAVDRVEPMSLADEHLLDIDGQVVDLANEKGKFIARGLFNSQSRIRVRLYTWSAEEPLDEAFFRRRLEASIELRRQIGYEPASRSESATRLVFSEADGISGLVVDRYGDYLVVQPTALGIAQRLESLVGILQELVQPSAVVLKLDRATAELEGIVAPEGESRRPGPLPEG